jgi:hypothetical protein
MALVWIMMIAIMNSNQMQTCAMGVVGKVNYCGQFNTLVHQTFVEELF